MLFYNLTYHRINFALLQKWEKPRASSSEKYNRVKSSTETAGSYLCKDNTWYIVRIPLY